MSQPMNPAEQRVRQARAALLLACTALLDERPGPDLALRELAARLQVMLRPGFEQEQWR